MRVRDAGTSVPPAGRCVALSASQRLLWFQYLRYPELQGFFNMSFVMRIEPRIDAVRVEQLLEELARRHTMLRVSFATAAGELMQQAHGAAVIPLQVVEIRGHDAANAIERCVETERHRAFEIATAPLARATLYQGGADFSVLLYTMDHLISDGWTGWQLGEQIVEILGSGPGEAGSQQRPAVPEFFDYVEQQQQWLASAQARRQLEYWQQELAQPTPPLELDYQRDAPEQRAAAVIKLDGALVRGLHELASRHGVSTYVALLAPYLVLLARLTGNTQLAVGAPLPGRPKEWYQSFGMFNNTVVLRAELTPGMRVAELLAQLRGTLFRALKNQLYPFAELTRHLLAQREHPESPLFQVWFNHQNARIDSTVVNLITPIDTETHVQCGDLRLRPFGEWHGSGGPGLDLLLETIEIGTQVRADLNYNAGRFDQATIERYLDYWQRLLAAMVANDQEQIDRLPMLSAAERAQVLYGWNAPSGIYSQSLCVHQQFELQVARTPRLVALEQGEQSISYAELNARANQLARHLRALGVRSEQRVALSMERSLEMVVGLLAILKAGGVYVPLEPSYPVARLQYILQDAAPCLLLTQRPLRGLLPTGEVPVFEVDADWNSVAALDATNLPSELGPTLSQLACIHYTSGSTGRPKGVMADHARTVNRMLDQLTITPVEHGEKCAQKTAIGFVDSIYETLHPLLAGGTLVVMPNAITTNLRLLVATLAAHRVVRWITVPSLAAALLLDEQCVQQLQGLRHWALSGEALPAHLLRELRQRLPNCCFINLYGASEATDATYYIAGTVADERRVPIGRPLAHTQMYILDAQGAPVPVGVLGEIYVAGVSLARGYVNLPELTAQRFLQDPFSQEPGARMYRTGDLGRWRSDGLIDCLGRNDHQVKIRGFRVELPEIEARLRELPEISAAAVVLREDAAGEKRLVAYYAGAELSAEALRAHLSQTQPEYMVPAAYVWLAALPLTPNGKLDRAALPKPGTDAYSHSEYAAPQGPVEVLLAQLWQELLQLERVGRHDHFFQLGGHSLLAVKLIDRLQQHGLHLQVRSLFSHPTLAALAAEVLDSRNVAVPENLIPAGSTTITPQMLPLIDLSQEGIDRIVAAVPGGSANVQDIYPLTPMQQGILFHHMLEQEDAYVLRTLLRFESRARLQQMLDLLNAMIARHDILRTAMFWDGLDEPVQVVLRQAQLSIEEVRLDPAHGSASEQLRALFADHRLDVRRAPLQRAFIARDHGAAAAPAADAWLLLLVSHHLVEDHTTVEELLTELQGAWSSHAAVATPVVPFRNFVAQTRRDTDVAAHEAFFQRMLGSIDEPTLPFGLERVSAGGRGLQRARIALDGALIARLRAGARDAGVSMATLFHVGWAQVLARAAAREQVVFGTVLFGRMHVEGGSQRAAGLFINTLPICVTVDQRSVRRCVQETQQSLVELLRHEHASLVLAQRCSAVPSAVPLFSALFNYRHSSRAHTDLHWDGMQVLWNEERSNYPLTCSVDDHGERITLTVLVEAPVEAERVCQLLTTALEHLADSLQRAATLPVRSLQVLPLAEQRVLEQWNQPLVDHGCGDCVHHWFEASVRRAPQAVALELNGEQLSYAALNRRANALAHYLRTLGVGPEARVALCMERSFATVVSVLAVLKAGGAYVPLDASYPRERLQLMLQDSRPCVLLVDASGRAVLPDLDTLTSARLIDIDAEQCWADQPTHDLERREVGLEPRHLAYVIYTSGSTGTPKGVMVEHRSVTRLFTATQAWFGFGAGDTWSLFHSYGFDFSVWELWGALAHGGRLVIVPLEVTRSPQKFHRLLCHAGVTVLNQTPSAFRQLIAAQAEGPQPHRLRYVIFGGEALDTTTLQRWYEESQNRAVQLVNMYGITEITVHATYRALTAADAIKGNTSIGQRIPDLEIHILDAQGRPAPIGVAGEIHIGGAGVARGYLHRDELTAQRFIPNPFSTRAGARLYRTGDLGRWRADGEIEYVGRNDSQVKIRGFRIELGEIEARLRSLPALRDAVVLARADATGEKRLVAYYVSDAEVSAESLRSHVAATLPAHMVPAAYVRLAALPLTANGKLDQRALPEPHGNSYAHEGYQAPHGELETGLATLWMELLKVERVGRRDNFFELGGHSLLAVSLAQLIRVQFQVDVSIAEIFEYPELGQLAERVTEAMLEQFDAEELSELGELLQ